MIKLKTPINKNLKSGVSLISGRIYCGRDMVLPKICDMIISDKLPEKINFRNSVIFFSAVSDAGVGPTSSNKKEIEESMPILAKSGVRLFIGKGKISEETIVKIREYNAIYSTVPPVSAYLSSTIISRKCIMFCEYGMEALFELKVKKFPIII